jgi:murein DD-endopeptidase MepM/ murein hydrolase activator NlpD
MPTPTTTHRDLSNPEFCDRSLERARRRRVAADAVRRQLARRRRATTAVLTAMLAGPPVQLAAAQVGGGDDDSTPTESPVRARDAQPSSLIFSLGSNGAAVADIQRSLGVAADGIFGPKTESAVRAYQAKNGLLVDGIVGPRTWATLFGGQAADVAPEKQSAPAQTAPSKPASTSKRQNGLVFVLDGGKAAESKPAKKKAKEPKVVKFKIRPHKTRKASTGGGSCASGTLRNPVPGATKTGYFGENRGDHIHSGDDLAIASGTPIHAAACGIVTELGMQGGYGNMICIKHSSRFTTCYAHMERFAAHMGQRVRTGQVIGFVGCTGSCTGPHVHFETRVNGEATDPSQYLRRGGRSFKARRASSGSTAQSSPSYSQPAAQGDTSGTGSSYGSSYGGSSGGAAYQPAPQAQPTPVYQQPAYQPAPQAQQAPVAQQPAPQAQPTTPAPVTESPAPSGGQQGQPSETPAVEVPAVKAPEVPGVTAPAQPNTGSAGTGGGQDAGQAEQPADAEQPQATQPSSGTGSAGTGTGSASTGSGSTGSGSTGSGSTGSSQGAGTGSGAPAGQ